MGAQQLAPVVFSPRLIVTVAELSVSSASSSSRSSTSMEVRAVPAATCVSVVRNTSFGALPGVMSNAALAAEDRALALAASV